MPLVTAEYSSIVHPSHHGQKIIDYLVSKFAYQSKDEWISKLSDGLMTVDGSKVDPNFKLQGKEELILRVENFDDLDAPPVPIWRGKRRQHLFGLLADRPG